MFGDTPFGSTPFGGFTQHSPDYFEDISIFVPLELKNETENTYVARQIEAFKHNQNLHNDYALLALHQLFMFATYGLIYSSLCRNEALVKNIFTLAAVRPDQRRQLMQISSPFALSLVNERTVFDILPVVGCNTTSEIATFKKIIDDRNDLAHCNGKMCVNFDSDVQVYIKAFESLYRIYAPITYGHLLDINKLDFGAGKDVQLDNLRIILSNNYVSQRLLELSLPSASEDGLTKRAHSLVMEYLTI